MFKQFDHVRENSLFFNLHAHWHIGHIIFERIKFFGIILNQLSDLIKNINKLIIIGCFNLAGVFVYVFNVMRNYSVDNALFIFSDIFNIILMLGSAAIGLLVYYEIPLLFVYISRATNQRHIASIDARVEKLKEIWGPEVTGK